MLELKSSLGYHWFQVLCFCLQIFSHVKNVGLIRSVDANIEERWKEKPLYLCLVLVALTIVGSSLASVSHFLRHFGNSLEDEHWTINQINQRRRFTLPYLTFFDIHLALLILLPSIILETQFIRGEVKDQSKMTTTKEERKRKRFVFSVVEVWFFNLLLISCWVMD